MTSRTASAGAGVKINLSPFFLLLTAAVLAAGCGYTIGPPARDGGAPPQAERTIAVPLLDNGTTEPLLGEIVSSRLKAQLQAAGPWRIVNASESPELLLNGRVTSLQSVPMAFDADSRATEYRVELRVSLTLTQTADGTVLWSASELVSAADYYASQDVAATRQSKERSFHDASQRLADQVAQQLSFIQ